MAKFTGEAALQIQDALDEFDLGMAFVAAEAESAAENEHVSMYVGGMLEGAMRAMMELVEPELRLLTVNEMQALVLDIYLDMEAKDGKVA